MSLGSRALLAVALLATPVVAADKYPEGADVLTLTNDGSAVGPLARLRVKGKYTVFDVYADWCGPCRLVDGYLKELLGRRRDIAVRKLNVVTMDSPLGLELGPDFDALPYVVVFSPDGERNDVVGYDEESLDDALHVP